MDAALEQLVWQRANRRCEYCQFPADVSLLPFQLDHIIAEKHRGPTTAENLALSCERCNLDGKHVPLFNPRLDSWSDHFEWRGAVLVAKTPVGQVTIDVLEINLQYRIVLRAALIAEGIH